jgi:Family of unknown function (DUF6529)
MEGLVEEVTRGNVTEVKVVLASVVAALAVYQVSLMAVGYGKVRPRFLSAGPASAAHRAIGDAIVLITVLVALMCLSYFEWGEAGVHGVAGAALLGLLALKVAVVRRGGRLARMLPVLGIGVLVLFALTWATSAGEFLAEWDGR